MAVSKSARDAAAPSRKNRILESAAQLFAEKGYETTTLTDLALSVDIAKATLFHYFNTKEKILFELYSQAMEMALERINSVEQSKDPAIELRGMLREHALVIMTNRSLYSIFFGEENGLEPEHLASIQTQQTEYLNIVATRVTALQKANRVAKDVHPRVAAQSLLGIGSWTYKWFQPGGDIPSTDIADFVANLGLNGLLKAQAK